MLPEGRLMVHITAILPFVVLLLFSSCHGQEGSGEAHVFFANTQEHEISLFWKNPAEGIGGDDELVLMEKINPFYTIELDSHVGHEFVATTSAGVSTTVKVQEETETFVFGPTEISVSCSTTEGTIRARIIPEWSPHGATQFLHLVNIGYYDGVALHRVVKNFLAQFGISPNYEKFRKVWRNTYIPDDPPRPDLKFQPGMLSFAGSDPRSRLTEVFVVMPNTPQQQLDYFGKYPWETPFGYVEQEDLELVVGKWYSGYGDRELQGNAPDPQKIHEKDGYGVYLKEKFPSLSYIGFCQITGSSTYQTKTTRSEIEDEDLEELL